MLVTKIDLSKGESFKTCVWKKATPVQEEKALKVIAQVTKYKQ